MMLIEERLYARLATVAQHVHPIVAPRDYATPCVIYNRVSTVTTRDIGLDLEDSAFVVFQVDVYATSLKEAKTMARALRASLKSWEDETIQSVALAATRDSVDDTTETQLFRVSQDFRIFTTDGF